MRFGLCGSVAGVYQEISIREGPGFFEPGGEERGAGGAIQSGFGKGSACGGGGRPGEGKDATGDGWIQQGIGVWILGTPQTLLFQAGAFRDIGQSRAEEGVYREILRRRPNYWLAYNELGFCLFRQTRYQDAVDVFAQGAAVAPRVALPLTNLGTMYLLLNRDKDAEDAFRRSLERAPNELAYSNLGSIAFREGNYKRAIEDYDKAIELNPKNHRTWRNLADSYAMVGDSKRQTESYAKAAEILSDALKVNPKPGANWVTLSLYHAKLGRRSDAEADLKAADQRGLDQRGQFTKAQTLAVLGRRKTGSAGPRFEAARSGAVDGGCGSGAGSETGEDRSKLSQPYAPRGENGDTISATKGASNECRA